MRTTVLTSLILSLLLFLLPLAASADQAVPVPVPVSAPAGSLPGTIERTTRQQLLVTIPAGTTDSPTPFLTSPSGKYTAFLLRTPTAPGAGGFGNDFCYIQVQETETSTPMWESECTPVSTANACSLVFNDLGLAIFDGSNSQWDTGAESADNNALERVELVDEGDMRIRDKIGELAWRASEDPRVGQRCGEPGSPGLGNALPPFAQPIGGGQDSLPFGQGQGQGNGAGQTFGFANGGSYDDSGSEGGVTESWVGVASGVAICLLGVGFWV